MKGTKRFEFVIPFRAFDTSDFGLVFERKSSTEI